MTLLKSKRKVTHSGPHIFKDKLSYKYVFCSKCETEEIKISEEAVSGICWRCCQGMVEPPKQLLDKMKKNGEPKRPRGWAWMAVFVDSNGNVFHKGVEQPDLKGTLEPTKIETKTKEKKTESSFHRNQRELNEQRKLSEKYKEKKSNGTVERAKKKNGGKVNAMELILKAKLMKAGDIILHQSEKATVMKDGRIKWKDTIYSSLSSSATAISGKSENGWVFWTTEKGEKLFDIRKQL